MKKILLGLTVLLSGCISMTHIAETSGIESEILKTVPKNATEVILKKDVSAIDLYNELYSSLLSRGHRIDRDDKERFYITTQGKDVGQSTLQRSTIVVTEDSGTSTAVIRSEWKPGTTATLGGSMFAGVGISADWEKATWAETGRPQIAMAEAIAIGYGVKGAVISFK
ncbi:hypothetical protein [Proteiniphilum saccharofermentans]|uniref:hypothetical protein n=1 Tax=Proteiniphilum saccharofermentans TaxID=1642647 RepID=UPI0028AAAC56|nr:hypothetical protein [Proteiniphilum saccharofermentans]